MIPRRQGESGCSGALRQQAWDRVWMVEIRTKELLPFFFLSSFFFTRHSLYFTKWAARDLRAQTIATPRHAAARGREKKFQSRDESALCFLLCLNPALQITLLLHPSLPVPVYFIWCCFTCPKCKHSCRSSHYTRIVSYSLPKTFAVTKLWMVMMPSLEHY